jgi:hypothetical protein
VADIVYENQIITGALVIDGADSVMIRNCYINAINENALWVGNITGAVTITNNILIADSPAFDALNVYSATSVEISNNTMRAAGWCCIGVFQCGSVVANNNIIAGTCTNAEEQMGGIWFMDLGSYDFSNNCFYGWIDGNIKDATTWPYVYIADPAGTVVADPLFVSSPTYAGTLFPNGYFLSQIAAGQSVNSPCVDAGIGVIGAGALLGTTRTDLVLDY